MLHEANEEGERMSVTITDEMIEAGLWAWILNATEGVARENVSQRVIDLNWHRAEATITAVLPLIEQAVRDRAADEIVAKADEIDDAFATSGLLGEMERECRGMRKAADLARKGRANG